MRETVDQLTIRTQGLDAIRVVTEDFSEGQGSMTITCYGRAWTAWWGGMGKENVQTFVRTCDTPYLVNCLVRGMTPGLKRFKADDENYLCRIVDAVRKAFDELNAQAIASAEGGCVNGTRRSFALRRRRLSDLLPIKQTESFNQRSSSDRNANAVVHHAVDRCSAAIKNWPDVVTRNKPIRAIHRHGLQSTPGKPEQKVHIALSNAVFAMHLIGLASLNPRCATVRNREVTKVLLLLRIGNPPKRQRGGMMSILCANPFGPNALVQSNPWCHTCRQINNKVPTQSMLAGHINFEQVAWCARGLLAVGLQVIASIIETFNDELRHA